ncbi:MAG: carbon storage regulator [Nannocystaceae bacterium]
MLVLSRKQDEWIMVRDEETGECLRFVVSSIRGRTVRLGFDAPKRFAILRDEVAVSDQKGGCDE